MHRGPFSARSLRRNILLIAILVVPDAALPVPASDDVASTTSEQVSKPDVKEADRSPGETEETDPQDIEALMGFSRDYGLKPGRVFKRIGPPFPKSRMAFYRIRNAKQAASIPDGPGTMIFQWNNGEPKLANMMFDDATRGASLRGLLPVLCQIGPERLRGQRHLLDQHFPGDYTFDKSAPGEKIVTELNRVLRDVKPHPVMLRLSEVEQDVYVARGTFKLSSTAHERGLVLIEDALVGTANSREEAIKLAHLAPRAHLGDLLNWVARSSGVVIVNEVKLPPKDRIRFNTVLGTDLPGDDSDPQPLLESVSEQTGLTFMKEKRLQQMLLVE